MKLQSLFRAAMLMLSLSAICVPASAEIQLEQYVWGSWDGSEYTQASRNATSFDHADTLMASTDGAPFSLAALHLNLNLGWANDKIGYATGYLNGKKIYEYILDFKQASPTDENNFNLKLKMNTSPVNLLIFNASGYPDGDHLSVLNYTLAVPEPETYAMHLVGLALIGSLVRRAKQQA
ncbi:PEP-CTERM sorting domain-containing protein [Undibacterium sp. Ren11W]|uniref:PEP-CTERM sorting domain-containing protein n=1 Tax=Undibacterium sp. Ren11W TaxID=3413045 RepID=UPI003BF25A65